MSDFFDFNRDVIVHDYHREHKYYISSRSIHQAKDTGLPANSTEINLPEKNTPDGMIYIFNGNGWDLVADTFNKPDVSEVSYIFTGDMSSDLRIEKIDFPFSYFPQYNDVVDYISSDLKTFHLSLKFTQIQKKYFYLLQLFYAADIKEPYSFHEKIIDYKLESELLVAMIKSFFDELVQMTYLLVNNDVNNFVDSIGLLIKKKDSNKECYDIFFGGDEVFHKDETDYLNIINELCNSIKHSSLHYESYSSYPTSPNIYSIYKKNNSFKDNKVVIHNHDLKGVVLGFKCNLRRIIENQRTYVNIKSEL